MYKNPEDQLQELKAQLQQNKEIDLLYGYDFPPAPGEYTGFLINFQETQIIKDSIFSALDCYFISSSINFKVQILYKPYVLIQIPKPNEQVLIFIEEQFQCEVEQSIKEDTQAPNHIAGQYSNFYKIKFDNRQQLQQFTKLFKDKQNLKILTEDDKVSNISQMLECIQKLSEFDVADGLRTSIDLDIRCGSWYKVNYKEVVSLEKQLDMLLHPAIRCLAYDIETSKAPLCFPNAENGDSVMCISYMLDGQGVLIVNRSIFSSDIEDFEYSPTQEMHGEFKIFNCQNEKDTILTFFKQIQYCQPHIIITYNGDQFDFKFLDQRSRILDIDFYKETGFLQSQSKGRFGSVEFEYKSRACLHIDCYRWVKRDSYLPQGSQGLKAVTKAKLKYQPMELDPELMTPYAKLQPQILAQYSVSDAVATYYLYKQFIHSFILALCTIIPLNPDSVLRKGTGTLCEALLMVKANAVDLLYPDKINNKGLQIVDFEADKAIERQLQDALTSNPSGVNSINTSNYQQFQIKDLINLQKQEVVSQDKKVLISQTYVGGRVEAIQAGVYRADFQYQFAVNTHSQDGYQALVDQLDYDLSFFVYTKFQKNIDQIEKQKRVKTKLFFPHESTQEYISENIMNYSEITTQVTKILLEIKDKCKKPYQEKPLIYHLDVSAMYPNIILTNRLQPHSIVTDKNCGTCDYNFPENDCKRFMSWIWRGIYYPCTIQEFNMIRNQVVENYPRFEQMPKEEKEQVLSDALDIYCQKVYKTRSKTIETLKQSCNCQRENPFFVDTVRAFRDLRYVYKGRQKEHTISMTNYDNQVKNGNFSSESERQQLIQRSQEQKQLVVLNESLQLAHKAILNSFYGYAMRAGSRWYSLEMAACVTFVGAQIIKQARSLVELIGLPLELDTDGIWCMLPINFPTDFTLQIKNGKNVNFEYPTIMLNAMTAKLFSNLQFQTRQSDLEDTFSHIFKFNPECSIEFELDGPYKCMFLSGAKEEGRQIKKRYAVFDFNNKISELKGFELKRRGELQIIKSFQQRIFVKFLAGVDLQSCYDSAADIADKFIDILYNEGKGYDSRLLQFLLQEQTTMKLSLVNTASNKKGTAVTCARRLSQAIDPIFAQVDGLCCVFVISRYPEDSPVSERSIPLQIFSCTPEKQLKYLKQWTKKETTNIAEILDWPYYWDRFQNQLFRIIVVPAGLQGLPHSPIRRIPYPDWLKKAVSRKDVEIETIMKFVNNNLKNDDFSDNEDDDTQVIVTAEDILMQYNINIEEVFDIDLLQQMSNKKTQGLDRNGDYEQWIQVQKQKWKVLLEFQQLNNSIQQQKFLRQNNKKAKGSTIFSQLGNCRENNYIVIHIENQQILGLINVLLLDIQTNMFAQVKVQVPQYFYINTQEDLSQQNLAFKGKIEKVNKILPRKTQIFNLFEVTMLQQDYLQQKEFIQQVKNSPLVENIYELQVDPASRFILNLGCHITLTQQSARDLQYNNVLQFKDIQINRNVQFDKKQETYFLHKLTDKPKIRIGILAHLSTAQGDIAIFIKNDLIILFSSCSNEILEDDKLKELTIDRLKSKLHTDNIQESVLFQYFNILNSDYTLIKVERSEDFLARIQLIINMEIKQSGIIIYSTNQHQSQFFKLLKENSLFINFPILSKNQSISDNIIELVLQFQNMDSYMHLCQVPLVNLLDSKQIYKKQVSQLLIACDFLYGRILMNNNCILWWSKNSQPDLGKDLNISLNVLPDYSFTYEYSGHYQGYTVVFDFKYIVAEVLSNIFNNHNIKKVEGGFQVKQFQKFINQINNSYIGSAIYSYLEQYIKEKESFLFDDLHQKIIIEQLGFYIQQIYNQCFVSDIIPVFISQKQLILSTNKIQEHLTTNQLNIFIQNLQSSGLLRIAKLVYRICYKQLLYIDSDNFYALSITNTLNKRTHLSYLLPLSLNKSLELILGCFLIHCSNIEGVSLLQVKSLASLPTQFFKWFRLKQLDLYSQDQKQQYEIMPFSLLSSITTILQLSMVQPDTIYQEKLLQTYIKASAQSLYLQSLRDFLSLSQPIQEDVKVLIDSMDAITQSSTCSQINSLVISIYCNLCNDFYHINLSKQMSEECLKCDICGNNYDNLVIEEKLISQFKEQMNLAQFQIIDDYIKVAEIRGFKILKSCAQQWQAWQ
ncbi:DNA polymerase epsilon, catalytic subunit [Spironucleus salmonicida]|uniref:DNA polymerase epsilon catalytic subunit n=1 Tax=Spironucleus salmonicida TaxID=348837 RepID=V6LVA4_9EUKA|nr:DNA polymerase epsilon, catalytic subunit [Spironucleus salmonicida]|eukprot:EST48525.1 DNA polymerase epsilon, catalytic subunit [Spironucleus salmonicida]